MKVNIFQFYITIVFSLCHGAKAFLLIIEKRVGNSVKWHELLYDIQMVIRLEWQKMAKKTVSSLLLTFQYE